MFKRANSSNWGMRVKLAKRVRFLDRPALMSRSMKNILPYPRGEAARFRVPALAIHWVGSSGAVKQPAVSEIHFNIFDLIRARSSTVLHIQRRTWIKPVSPWNSNVPYSLLQVFISKYSLVQAPPSPSQKSSQIQVPLTR